MTQESSFGSRAYQSIDAVPEEIKASHRLVKLHGAVPPDHDGPQISRDWHGVVAYPTRPSEQTSLPMTENKPSVVKRFLGRLT